MGKEIERKHWTGRMKERKHPELFSFDWERRRRHRAAKPLRRTGIAAAHVVGTIGGKTWTAPAQQWGIGSDLHARSALRELF
jgi:hypothetical protein